MTSPDLRTVLGEAQFAAHQLARHPGHPRDCQQDQCARWLALAADAPTPAVERCAVCGMTRGYFWHWSTEVPAHPFTPPAPESSAALVVEHEAESVVRACPDCRPAPEWSRWTPCRPHERLYASLLLAAARSEVDVERLARALDAVPWEPVRDPLDMVTYEEAAAQLAAAYREADR